MRDGVSGAYKAARRRRQFYSALAALAVMAAGLPRLAAAQPFPVQTQADLPYGPLPEEHGDLLTPAGPAGPHPAVLIIHGGGWINGSRHGADGFAAVLASMGVVVFNVDYRLANKALPDTRWPAQLVDVQLAVRFLRANAAQYGIDPARIGAVGDSAGGQLAVFLGVLPGIVPGDQASLYPQQRPDVKAVVDQYGVMDLPGMGQYGVGSIEAMFGTATPPDEVVLTASPLPSVTARSAPMYIIHGQSDEVVPFQQSLALQAALRGKGVPVELVPFKGGHAYDGVSNDEVGKLQFGAIRWLLAKL